VEERAKQINALIIKPLSLGKKNAAHGPLTPQDLGVMLSTQHNPLLKTPNGCWASHVPWATCKER
jgi:hypothetical protein